MNQTNKIQSGIILHKDPRDPSRLCIFDEYAGTFFTTVHNQITPVGALVEYVIKRKNNYIFVDHFSIVYAPAYTTTCSLYFFHHIFEFCFHSIPLFRQENECFTLIKKLYFNKNIVESSKNKLLFFIKLIVVIGFYPEMMSQLSDRTLDVFVNHSMEELCLIEVSCQTQKELFEWLVNCLEMHPYCNKFKTIKFFKESMVL